MYVLFRRDHGADDCADELVLQIGTSREHRLAAGLSPGSTLSVTCRSRNRPRMSSQVSRCLPRLARQLRLGPLSQCSGCVSASHPQHVLSKQGQFPAGWCSCSAALRPYPAVGGGAMVFRCGRRRLRLSTRAGRPAWAVRVGLIYWLWQYLLLSLDRYFYIPYAST